MTLHEFIKTTEHIMAPTRIAYQGRGTVTFVTPDDYSAGALEARARNAGLKVLRTTTDEGNHVVGVSAFDRGENL